MKTQFGKKARRAFARRTAQTPLRRHPLTLLILVAATQMGHVRAAPAAADASSMEDGLEPSVQPLEFSASFLSASSASQVDLSRFASANAVLPGEYSVDLYVNQIRLARETIRFVDFGGRVQPCFDAALVRRMGVDTSRLDGDSADPQSGCIDLEAAIADARIYYDAGALRLEVSLPQISLHRDARGHVAPERWERGVPAFLLGYSLNVYQHGRRSGGMRDRNAYLGLNAGLNAGGWRLRNQSSYRWWRGHGSEFQNIATYAQRDITAWTSQLTLGDGFTTGELFDSTAYRGASLATDDRMRPDSLNGYAPVVRGIAETHARVEIRQDGYLIHDAAVAPGAFEITDLYPTGYGGDLEVTVIESDGRRRSFSVPFASVPGLLRPGVGRYAATLAQVRDDRLGSDAPLFLEATWQRGLNNWVTTFAGVQATEGNLYRAWLAGAAFNTPVGALSMDLTRTAAAFPGKLADRKGHSLRATYSKSIPATWTNFVLAAYRYSSRGYLNLGDAAQLAHWAAPTTNEDWPLLDASPRNRLQLTLNQRLGATAGSLFVSGTRSSYRDRGASQVTYQMGYSHAYRSLSYGLSVNHTRDMQGRYDNQYYLSLSLPLGGTGSHRPPRLSLNTSHGRDNNDVRVAVNGSAGARDQFNYGVSANYGSAQSSGGIGANLGWRAPYAMLGLGYSRSPGQTQMSASASGGVLVHPGGVSLGQQFGDTIAIIEAKGAEGAYLHGNRSVRIDRRGYAVLGSLMPYRLNDVSLNPKGLRMGMELDSTRAQVVPRAGAVVPVRFLARGGSAALIQILRQDGSWAPFGAEALDAQGNRLGTVGQGGQIFLRSLASGDEVVVRWGQAHGQQCRFAHPSIGEASGKTEHRIIETACRSGGEAP